jgi:hypothetical protein
VILMRSDVPGDLFRSPNGGTSARRALSTPAAEIEKQSDLISPNGRDTFRIFSLPSIIVTL